MATNNSDELDQVAFSTIDLSITVLVALESTLSPETEGVELAYIIEFPPSIELLEGREMTLELEGKVWVSELVKGTVDSNLLSKRLASRSCVKSEISASMSPCIMATTRAMVGRFSADMCKQRNAMFRILSTSTSSWSWRESLGSKSCRSLFSSRSFHACQHRSRWLVREYKVFPILLHELREPQ